MFVIQINTKGGWPLRYLTVPLCLALAACGHYPRDVEGTLEDIERGRQFRVGLTELSEADRPTAQAFVDRIERATAARATIDMGPAEVQLARLENDDLDLVIGTFAEDSPWSTDFAILEPLSWRRVGGRVIGLSVVAANGENRWIALLEREIRDRGTEVAQ